MSQTKERRDQIKAWKEAAGVNGRDTRKASFEAYGLNQAELAKLHNTDLTTDYALVNITRAPSGYAIHTNGKTLGIVAKVPSPIADAFLTSQSILGFAGIFRTQRDGWVARIETSNPPTNA